MGAVKNYLLDLLQAGDNQLEQDSIEWGLHSDWFKPTFNLAKDHEALRMAMPHLVDSFRRLAEFNEMRRLAQLQELVGQVDDYK